MQSYIAMLVAVVAIITSFGLNFLQGQRNTAVTDELAALRESEESRRFDPSGLEQRLADLETGIEGLPSPFDPTAVLASISALEAELAALRESEESRRFDPSGLEQRLADLETGIEGLPSPFDPTAVLASISALEAELAALRESEQSRRFDLSGLEQRLAGLEAGIEGLPSPFDPTAVLASISALEAELAALRESEESRRFDPSGLEQRLAGLEAGIEGLSSPFDPTVMLASISALEAELAALRESAESRRFDPSGLEQRLADLETGIEGLPSPFDPTVVLASISALEAELAALRDSEESRRFDPSGLEQRLADLETGIEGLPSPFDPTVVLASISALEAELAALSDSEESRRFDPSGLEQRLADLEAGIEGLPSPFDSTAVLASMSALEAELAALRDSEERRRFDPSGLEQRLAGLEAGIEGLPSPFDPTAVLASMSALEAELAALRDSEERRRFDPSGLEQRLADLEDGIEGLPSPFDPTAVLASMSALEAELAALRESEESRRFDPSGLEQRLAGLEARLSQVETKPESADGQNTVGLGKFRLLGEVFFDVGRFELSASQRAALVQQLSDFSGLELFLVGSSDRVGGESRNATLSLLRATSVQKAIVEELGRPVRFVSVDGVGELGAPVPTLDNQSEARNRRVGIYDLR